MNSFNDYVLSILNQKLAVVISKSNDLLVPNGIYHPESISELDGITNANQLYAAISNGIGAITFKDNISGKTINIPASKVSLLIRDGILNSTTINLFNGHFGLEDVISELSNKRQLNHAVNSELKFLTLNSLKSLNDKRKEFQNTFVVPFDLTKSKNFSKETTENSKYSKIIINFVEHHPESDLTESQILSVLSLLENNYKISLNTENER